MRTVQTKRRTARDRELKAEVPAEFVSPAFVAERVLGCHHNSIPRYVKSGRIPKPIKVGGLQRFHLASVREALLRGTSAAAN